jgi:NAD-dependent deacetylase
VYPAAGLIQFTKSDAQIYLIDPAEVRVPYGLPVHVIKKGASQGMRELVALLDGE